MGQHVHPVRAYRREKGISLASLAKLLGTSKANLSRVENFKQPVSATLLPKISLETGISLERLVHPQALEIDQTRPPLGAAPFHLPPDEGAK
jgi:transcriptional regulator with XRE-family HTH domain